MDHFFQNAIITYVGLISKFSLLKILSARFGEHGQWNYWYHDDVNGPINYTQHPTNDLLLVLKVVACMANMDCDFSLKILDDLPTRVPILASS